MIERYSIPPPEKDEPTPHFQNPTETCGHNYELRRMICSNSTVQYRKQCTVCGNALSAISPRKLSEQQQDQAPPFDQTLRNRISKIAFSRWRDSKTSANRYWKNDWWAWYNVYLASPVWSRRRAAVLKRGHGVCESCGKTHATIAHHLTYDHVGAEPLFDLVAVCPSCHKQIHPQEDQ